MSVTGEDEARSDRRFKAPRSLRRAAMILPPILIGALVLVWQITGREGPQQSSARETARVVRVVEARATDFLPRAEGYGLVEPGRVWEAVAQVEGRIAARHPDLDRGQILEAGTELLRIDPTDYELAVARAEASLARIRAQLAELDAEQKNLEASLEIESRGLALEERELERQRKLLARGTVSQTSADEAERNLLRQRQSVQGLENELRLLPSRRADLEASGRQSEAELKEARVDLERTVIRLPFAARIARIDVEATQFVRSGDRLVTADSIDTAEVAVQIPLERMRTLVPPDLDVTGLSAGQLSELARNVGFKAEVRLPQEGFDMPWTARFDRTSDTVDPQTRSLGVIVVVDKPYGAIVPGQRPPLTKNMFVQVEISGRPRRDKIVIPRIALQGGAGENPTVYLAGPDDRLILRDVTPGPEQGDVVVIEKGLEPGERILVTDLVPAIEGMLLEPRLDEALMQQVATAAAGPGSAR